MKIFETEKSSHIRSENYNFDFNKETGFFARWGKTKEDDPQMAPMPEILDLEISQGKCSGKCPECYKCNGDVDYVDNMSFDTFRRIFHKVAKTKVIQVYDKRLYGKINIDWFLSLLPDLERYQYDFSNCMTKEDIFNEVIDKDKKYGPHIHKPEEYNYHVINDGLLTQIAFGICDLNTNPDFIRMMRYCREFDVVPNFTFNGNGLTEELADEIAKVAGAVAISVRGNTKYYRRKKVK